LGHGDESKENIQNKFRDMDDEPPDSADTVGQEFEKDAIARYMREHGFEGDPEDFLKAVIEQDSAAAGAGKSASKEAEKSAAPQSSDAVPHEVEGEAEGKHVFRSRTSGKQKAKETAGGEDPPPKKKKKSVPLATLSFDTQDE